GNPGSGPGGRAVVAPREPPAGRRARVAVVVDAERGRPVEAPLVPAQLAHEDPGARRVRLGLRGQLDVRVQDDELEEREPCDRLVDEAGDLGAATQLERLAGHRVDAHDGVVREELLDLVPRAAGHRVGVGGLQAGDRHVVDDGGGQLTRLHGRRPYAVAGRRFGTVARVSDDAVVLELDGHEVRVTHPDKVFFPRTGHTKLDLVEYYRAVEEPLLRAMRGRPVLLERYPDGAGGKSFFQKRVPSGAPEWLRTTVVTTPNGTPSNALVAADLAHIVWAVNMGCLGFHVWPYLATDPAHTDELRIDLDPQPGVTFDEVRAAAHEVHALCEELGI